MDLRDLSLLATMERGRGAFNTVCQSQDPKKAHSFLRTMNVMITCVFLLFVGIGIIAAVVITSAAVSSVRNIS